MGASIPQTPHASRADVAPGSEPRGPTGLRSPLRTFDSGCSGRWGRAPCPVLHAKLGTRPPVTLATRPGEELQSARQLPEPPAFTSRPRCAETPGAGSPGLPAHGQPAPTCPPAREDAAPSERFWCQRKAVQGDPGRPRSICRSWAFPSSQRGFSSRPSQKHLPSSGSLKFKQTTTRREEGRGSGRAS